MKIDGSDHFDPYLELRRRAARVCEHFPAKYWGDIRTQGSYPSAFLRALTQFRLMALTIPTSCGGAGLGMAAACAVVQELHRRGCDSAKINLQYALCFALAPGVGSSQHRPWMSDIANGYSRLQMCNLFEARTDLFAYRIRGGGYQLDGRSRWPERTEHCDLTLLVAEESDHRTQSAFIVNVTATPGVRLRPNWTDDGRGKVQLVAKRATLREDGRLPAADDIVRRASAAKTLLECGARLGDAKALYRLVLSQTLKGDGEHQDAVQARQAIRAADGALRSASRLLDDGAPCATEMAIAKECSLEARAQIIRLCDARGVIQLSTAAWNGSVSH
jgi:acyl-CoA dehydrogenase